MSVQALFERRGVASPEVVPPAVCTIQQFADESNQQTTEAGKQKVLTAWRAKLGKEPTSLTQHPSIAKTNHCKIYSIILMFDSFHELASWKNLHLRLNRDTRVRRERISDLEVVWLPAPGKQ